MTDAKGAPETFAVCLECNNAQRTIEQNGKQVLVRHDQWMNSLSDRGPVCPGSYTDYLWVKEVGL